VELKHAYMAADAKGMAKILIKALFTKEEIISQCSTKGMKSKSLFVIRKSLEESKVRVNIRKSNLYSCSRDLSNLERKKCIVCCKQGLK
jgi:hypothetical protein